MNLSTWHGVGRDFLDFDSRRSGNGLYVHLKYTKVRFASDRTRRDTLTSPSDLIVISPGRLCPRQPKVPIETPATDGETKAEEVTRLGIGVEGVSATHTAAVAV